MCGRVKIRGHDVHVGDNVSYTTSMGLTVGMFGILPSSGPVMYNARVEHIDGTWKHLIGNRGVLEIEGFYEEDSYFTSSSGKPLQVAVLYNKDLDFLIVTRSARPPVVNIHSRQPLLVEDTEMWITKRYIVAPKDKLKKEAA